jgi:hypothetical protein
MVAGCREHFEHVYGAVYPLYFQPDRRAEAEFVLQGPGGRGVVAGALCVFLVVFLLLRG